MKLGIETMYQILLLCGAVFCLVALIGVNQYILGGRMTLHNIINQVECSENRESTLESCKLAAKEQGYIITWKSIDEKHPDDYLINLTSRITYKGTCFYEGTVQGYIR